MTCIKKIDWLRHLYHESTRWLNSLTGQVKWRELPAKDPNNGSKIASKDLEATLPNMLQKCIDQNLVPRAYDREVRYFLCVVGKKIDNAVLADLVHTRKNVLILMNSLEMFHGLSEEDRIKVLSMVDVGSIHHFVTILAARLREMGIQAHGEPPEASEEDKSSKFKPDDWLRHMYLKCQKWLNNEAGQVQWRNLTARDPNNSKEGNKMTLEEIKESLKVLVSGLPDHLIPRLYRSEIDIIRKVLCCNEGKFINRILSAEEHLRKVALKLDVFGNLGDPQTVLAEMDTHKLPVVLSAVVILKEHLGAEAEVENLNVGGVVEAVPDLLENQISEEINENGTQVGQGEGTRQEGVHEGTSEPVNTSAESDGTEYLNQIIDQLSHQEEQPLLTSDVNSYNCQLQEEFSPGSPYSQEDWLSENSGFHSPEHSILVAEIADALERETPFDELGDLDYSTLPTVYPRDDGPEFSKRKRKRSIESNELQACKKAKP